MFFSPQDYLIYEQNPQALIQGAKFALKTFFIIALPFLMIGLLVLLSRIIVVPELNGTELF
jgi:hypothetical protein